MKKIFKLFEKKEVIFLMFMTFIIAVLIMTPLIIGYLFAPAGYTYSGIGSLTPGDNPVYYSYINQIKNGQWLIKDFFTGERQDYGMFNIFWFLAGKFAWLFDLSPIFTFHFLKLCLLPFFILTAYWFISFFFEEIKQRRIATYFFLLAGGLGAYIILPLTYATDLMTKKGYWTPNDIWIPESLAFLSLYKTPHFIASWIMMMLILLILFLAISRNKPIFFVVGGFLSLVYFNFHPFYVPMIFLTSGVYLLYEIFKEKRILWKKCFWFCVFVLISSPSIFYHAWLLKKEPALSSRAWQNITLAPPFIFIIVGYGFLFVFGLLGIYGLFKTKKIKDNHIFLLIWLLVSIALVLAPWQFQSRNTQGIHLPLAIFSAYGYLFFRDGLFFKNIFAKVKFILNDKFLIFLFFILIFFPSIAFNLVRDIYYYVAKPKDVVDLFFVNNERLFGIHFLDEADSGQVIISHPLNGLYVGALTQNRSYFAHPIETTDFKSKSLWVLWFYKDNNHGQEKEKFLSENNINYVFYSSLEKELGSFEPGTQDYLSEVYSNDEVKIYKVK